MPNTGGSDGSIIIDTELDNDGFRAGSEKLLKAVEDVSKAIDNLGDNMMNSFNKIVPMLQAAAAAAAQAGTETRGAATQVEEADAGVSGSAQRMADTVNSAAGSIKKHSDNMRDMAGAAKSAQSSVDNAASGVKNYDKALARVQTQIDKAKEKLAGYYKELAEIQASTDEMLTRADTDDQAAKVMEIEEQSVARLNEKYASRISVLERLEAQYAELAAQQAQANVTPAGDEETEQKIGLWGRLGQTMQTVGSVALQTGKSFLKLPFVLAGKGMQKLANSCKDFIKKARETKLRTNALVKSLTSLKRMLITRIKRMFISEIFNQAKESLQTLAKFSDAFNSSMSNIKNSSKQLAGNLAVSLGNVINSLAPLITNLLNKIAQAITYINALFAMLGGKSTMIVAKKQTDSYRDSLKGAAGAAEDLKNQVYGFDELNKRSDNDSGGGALDGSDLYEEVPVDSILPEKFKDLFEELKALWDNEEYFNFGKRIGEELNGVIKTVDDWINGTLRPKGAQWAKNIAEVFSGLMVGIDWGLVFQTVIDAFSALEEIILGAISGIHWKEIAQALAKGVNKININTLLTNIGKIVSGIVNGAFDFALGLIETIDWGALTGKIVDGVVSALQAVDFGSIISKAFELLGAAFGAMSSIVVSLGDKIWGLLKQAWESVKTYFNEYIQGFGGDIIAGLWAGIKNAFVNVGTWIYENIFKPFIDGFKKAFGINSPSTVMAEQGHFIIEGLLKGIKEKWEAVKSFISTAMANMKERITTTADQIKTTIANKWDNIKTNTISKWTEIKSSVTERWNNLKTQLKSTEWGSVGNHLVTGLKNGIVNAWTSLKTTVANLAQRLTDTLKNAFSINSPSKVWAQIGEYLDLGLKQGLEDKSRAILATVSNLAQNVSERMAGSNALISADFNGDGALSSLSGIADKLMLIADVFRGISNMITNIGDIRIPAIAYGSAVPYKTRISDSGPDDPFTGGAFNAFSAGLDERLYDLALLMREVKELLKNKDFVDNRELAQAIALALQGMPRGFGGA